MFLSSGITTALQFTGPEQINADDDDSSLLIVSSLSGYDLVVLIS